MVPFELSSISKLTNYSNPIELHLLVLTTA